MALYWNRGSAVKFKRTDWGFLHSLALIGQINS